MSPDPRLSVLSTQLPPSVRLERGSRPLNAGFTSPPPLDTPSHASGWSSSACTCSPGCGTAGRQSTSVIDLVTPAPPSAAATQVPVYSASPAAGAQSSSASNAVARLNFSDHSGDSDDSMPIMRCPPSASAPRAGSSNIAAMPRAPALTPHSFSDTSSGTEHAYDASTAADSDSSGWLVDDDEEQELASDSESYVPEQASHEACNDCTRPFQSERTFPSWRSQRGRAARQGTVKQLYALMNGRVWDGALPSDLEITWNARLTKTAGLTYTRAVLREDGTPEWHARVELSVKVVDRPCRAASTLLHELCHVAAWVIDHSNRPPHGRVFKRWAAAATACFPEWEVTTRHTYAIEYKFHYGCTTCGHVYARHSKSIDTDTARCGLCQGVLELQQPSNTSTPARVPSTPLRESTSGNVASRAWHMSTPVTAVVPSRNPAVTPAKLRTAAPAISSAVKAAAWRHTAACGELADSPGA